MGGPITRRWSTTRIHRAMVVLGLGVGALLWPVPAVVANEGNLPPPSENGPVPVSTGVYLLDIGNINVR